MAMGIPCNHLLAHVRMGLHLSLRISRSARRLFPLFGSFQSGHLFHWKSKFPLEKHQDFAQPVARHSTRLRSTHFYSV